MKIGDMNLNYTALYEWRKTALPYKFYRSLTDLYVNVYGDVHEGNDRVLRSKKRDV